MFAQALTAFVLICLCSCGRALAAPSFSKSYEFTPIKMSQADLAEVIRKARVQMSQGDVNSKGKSARETLSITDGETTAKFENGFPAESLNRAPKVAFGVEYSHFALDGSMRVSIDLSDYRRRLVVEGDSPEQVEANFLLLKNTISALDSSFGGYAVRFWGWVIGNTLAVLLTIFLIRTWQLPGRWWVLCYVPQIALLVAMNILPWNRILPGFVIYAGDASFAGRYSAEIGILGLILGILGLAPLLPVFFRLARRVFAPSVASTTAQLGTNASSQAQSSPKKTQSKSKKKR